MLRQDGASLQRERCATMAAAPGKEQGHGRVVGSRYTMGDEIGRGASGVVHKALNFQTGGAVAIKEVALRGVSRDQLQLLQREIDLLKLLKNPYIVEYRESFNTRDTLYIVMEFVENGSLSNILRKFGRLPEALVSMYTLQVLEAHPNPEPEPEPEPDPEPDRKLRCSRGCTSCTSRA